MPSQTNTIILTQHASFVSTGNGPTQCVLNLPTPSLPGSFLSMTAACYDPTTHFPTITTPTGFTENVGARNVLDNTGIKKTFYWPNNPGGIQQVIVPVSCPTGAAVCTMGEAIGLGDNTAAIDANHGNAQNGVGVHFITLNIPIWSYNTVLFYNIAHASTLSSVLIGGDASWSLAVATVSTGSNPNIALENYHSLTMSVGSLPTVGANKNGSGFYMASMTNYRGNNGLFLPGTPSGVLTSPFSQGTIGG